MQLPQSDIGSVANCEKTSKASPPRFSQARDGRRRDFVFVSLSLSALLENTLFFFSFYSRAALCLDLACSFFHSFLLVIHSYSYSSAASDYIPSWYNSIPLLLQFRSDTFSLFQCWIGVFGGAAFCGGSVSHPPSFANVVHNSCLYALCGLMVPALAW